MANKSYNVVDAADNITKLAIRLIDNGDGTYSLATAGAGGGTSSTVTGNVASGATDAGNPVKVGGVYNLTPPTLVTAQRGDLQLDASGYLKDAEQYQATAEDNVNGVIAMTNKPVVSATYSWVAYVTFGTVTKAVVKASAGNLGAIDASNANAALRYLQLHNKATAPIAGDVPVHEWPLPAGSATVPITVERGADFFGVNGMSFATGIAWAISTTSGTFTDAASAADHRINASYI